MADDVDRSLLHRLQALRGSSATPEPTTTGIDGTGRARTPTPTREDALAARLKRLRDRAAATAPSSATEPSRSDASFSQADKSHAAAAAAAVDAVFATDDATLEQLLGDVDGQAVAPPPPPRDDEVAALLAELSLAVPMDRVPVDAAAGEAEEAPDPDHDFDAELVPSREVDAVIARLRDEAELEAALARTRPSDASQESKPGPDAGADADDDADNTLALPSLPPSLAHPPSATHPADTALDTLAARIAALRAPSDAAALPSVPTSTPSGSRLASRTAYTDDDADSWCIVCLADAALRCLGCDSDPYCVRCWTDMHRGPDAAFDDKSHRAVQFTRSRKREDEQEVALGVS